MKGSITEIIKDVFISILVIACIVIILSLIFYDKIAISRVVPQAEEYLLSEEMNEEIQESILEEESEEVIINYYIDNKDLKKYEKNNEYVKGKNNPFAATSDYTGNGDVSLNNTISSDSNGGFYKDEGIK